LALDKIEEEAYSNSSIYREVRGGERGTETEGAREQYRAI